MRRSVQPPFTRTCSWIPTARRRKVTVHGVGGPCSALRAASDSRATRERLPHYPRCQGEGVPLFSILNGPSGGGTEQGDGHGKRTAARRAAHLCEQARRVPHGHARQETAD